MNTLNYIDLFAGAGGLSEGFIQSGYKPIAHVEMDQAAAKTLLTRQAYYYLKENNQFKTYAAYLKGEISRSELYDLIPQEEKEKVINMSIGANLNDKIFKIIDSIKKENKVDLIIGGPPCQAYSLVGRARDENGMESDSRNYLYLDYVKYLKKYKPKVFVFENVLGLRSAKGGFYLKDMRAQFRKAGYITDVQEVEANCYGVLQNRKRLIIIGFSETHFKNIPVVTLEKIKQEFTVKSLFNDLPPLNAGEGKDKFLHYSQPASEYLNLHGLRNGLNIVTQHITRPHNEQDKEIYRIAIERWNSKGERLNYNDLPDRLKTHQNRHSFFDRFKVVAADKHYSHTVVAHIAKDGHYYIHPDLEQNRSISVREAARLQSFPDDYYFEGVKEGRGRTSAFKQIGNAVPPLLAKAIANKLKEILY